MVQLRMLGSSGRPLAFIAALALAACAVLPPPVSQRPGTELAAENAARKGDHVQAATQYEALAAAASAAQQPELQLAAAREWLAAGRSADATRVLAGMNASQTPAQSLERSLLEAETSLLANRPQEAWQRISAISESSATSSSAAAGAPIRYYSLKMRIALAVARPVDAVRAEMAAEAFAANPAERTQLRSRLLAALRDAREHGVKLEAQASPDPIVRGWLDLGAIATDTHGTSLIGESEAASWRAKYPNHPALEVLGQALPAPIPAPAPGGRIALLLPLTGAAAGPAATVRDGFLSAYYQLPEATRPALQIYDTGAVAAADSIGQARAAGSSFIVGPLTREDVAAVADLGTQSVPVLALNFLPAERTAPSGLFQFALSPEEEAQIVARRILADGRHRGVALVPHGDWGNRVIDAFTRELTAGGGSLITQSVYDPAEHDYSYEIKSILRIDDSDERHLRLQNVLGTKLNFEPRHRGDIEFVFVVPEGATNARLIVPQLKFFYAGDIPSYSLSNAYEPDSTDSNRDIDGLMYPDMPWLLDDSSLDAIRSSIQQGAGAGIAWHSRLFAFGYDACQLMLAMSGGQHKLTELQVAGLSGQLHFDERGRVRRELIWVQIRDGEPRRLGASAADTP
ncbi:MAG TPA: penicillin-binding protein activator [Steroidobacteraceae bacterium]